MHMVQGKDGPRKGKSGEPTMFFRADIISEAAKQRGQSFTKVETGDTRAISKPAKKKET